MTPGALSLGVVVKVMQELLVDRVPVRNIRTIAETLAEHGTRTQDPLNLLGHVREALGGSIVQSIYGLRNELPVITLDASLEQLLRDGFKGGDGSPTFEPGLADRLHGALLDATQQQELKGEPAVLLVPTQLRPWLARFTRHGAPNLAVLAYGEIPHNKSLRVVASVGSPSAAGRDRARTCQRCLVREGDRVNIRRLRCHRHARGAHLDSHGLRAGCRHAVEPQVAERRRGHRGRRL